MLLTEEQAKTKWCPHARVVDDESDNAGGCNRWIRKKDETLCIASACMAWWWAEAPRETIRNYHDAPAVERLPYEPFKPGHRYPDGWQYNHTDTDQAGRTFDLLHRLPADTTPTHGYCGAFGKPEA